jgi:hypothetical protein
MSLSDILQKLGLDDFRYPLMEMLNLHPLGLREDWRTCREDLMTAIKPFVVIDIESYSDSSQGLLSRIPDQYPISKWEREEVGGLNMKETLATFFRARRCRCCSRHSHRKPNLVRRAEGRWGKYSFERDETRVPECSKQDHCDCECMSMTFEMMNLIRWRMCGRPELMEHPGTSILE